MHAGSFFALIWFALIVVGVVSSIRKSVSRARDPQEAQRRAEAAAAQRAQLAAAMQAARAARVTQPVARRAPPPPKPAPASAPPAPAGTRNVTPPVVDAFAVAPREEPLRKRLFSSRAHVLRAMAAAEVLAPPIALRDDAGSHP